MILAEVRDVPGSASAERGTLWHCSCEWKGRRYEAFHRTAILELCRTLKEAGCPDQEMTVRWQDRSAYNLKSIHKAAARAIKESAREPIHEAPYEPLPERVTALSGKAQNMGSEGQAALEEP